MKIDQLELMKDGIDAMHEELGEHQRDSGLMESADNYLQIARRHLLIAKKAIDDGIHAQRREKVNP